METDSANGTGADVSQEDIEKSLFDLYRAITHPAGHDYDDLLETVRWQLMQRGHDVDSWPSSKPRR